MRASRSMIIGEDYLICHSRLNPNEKEVLEKLRTSYAIASFGSESDEASIYLNGEKKEYRKNHIYDIKKYYGKRIEIENINEFDFIYRSYSTFNEKDIPIHGESFEIDKEFEISNDSDNQKILVCYTGEFLVKNIENEIRFHPLKIIRLTPKSKIKIIPIINGIVGIFEK